MDEADRAELYRLRAERDAMLSAERQARLKMDEYEILTQDHEKEKVAFMAQQAEVARARGDTSAARTLEELRQARVSCSNHSMRERSLEHQLAAARLSCSRHKASAEQLENEADMFIDLDNEPQTRLQNEVASLKEEISHFKHLAEEAWAGVEKRESRITHLDSQCELLAAQLTSECAEGRAALAKIWEANCALRDSLNNNGNSTEAREHLSKVTESEGQRLEARIQVLTDFEGRLKSVREASKQRDEVMEEQVKRLGVLEAKLCNSTAATQATEELQKELQQREEKIAELTASLETVQGRMSANLLGEDRINALETQLASSRMSTARRETQLEELDNERRAQRVKDEEEIKRLQQRILEAEKESTTHFLEAEQMAELTQQVYSKRLSCDAHTRNEADLRGELSALAQRLQDEHKQYSDTLYRQLNNVKATAEDDMKVMTSELDIASKEKANLRKELQALRLDNKCAEDSAIESNRLTQEATLRVKHLEEQLQQISDGTAPTAEQMHQLKTELATYRTIAADREQSIQALQKEVKSTVDEVERLRAALLEKTIALETKGGDAEQVRSRDVKIESLCAELAKTEATLSQKQQSLANAQQRMDRMVKDISDLQKSLADTQEIVVEREYDIGVLIEDAEEAKAEKEQLASDRAELKRIKAKKTALEADLRTAKRDVKKYELASSSREMEFMELESALTSTRLSCDRRSAALKDKTTELGELKRDFAKKQSESSSTTLRKEHERLKRDYEALTKKHNSCETELRQAKRKRSEQDPSNGVDVERYIHKNDELSKINTRLKRKLQEKTREAITEPSPSPVVPNSRHAVNFGQSACAPPLLHLDCVADMPKFGSLNLSFTSPTKDDGSESPPRKRRDRDRRTATTRPQQQRRNTLLPDLNIFTDNFFAENPKKSGEGGGGGGAVKGGTEKGVTPAAGNSLAEVKKAQRKAPRRNTLFSGSDLDLGKKNTEVKGKFSLDIGC